MATVLSLPSTSTSTVSSTLTQRPLVSRGMAMATISSPLRNSSRFLLHLRCRFVPQYRNAASCYCSSKPGFGSNLESTGVPTSVPVRVAHELLQAGHRYLDVRMLEEFNSGHVPEAINIPYMLRFGLGMTKNSEFLDEVSKHFSKDDEILIG